MSSVSSLGLGSGIDIRQVVDGLVEAEGEAELKILDNKEKDYTTKVSAYGTLKSALLDFEDALDDLQNSSNGITSRTVVSEDESYFTAVANSAATPGTYHIRVTDVAKAKSAVTNTAFGGATSIVGTGTITLAINLKNYVINIGANNSSLQGISNAINDISNQTGVVSNIIRGDAGYYLQINSQNTGTQNSFTITAVDDGGNNLNLIDEANLDVTQIAHDAVVIIDGVTVTSQSNVVDEAIPGVSIDVIAASGLSAYALTVDYDRQGALSAIQNFVNKYNALVDVFTNMMSTVPAAAITAEDSTNEVATKKQHGILVGDATMRSIQSMVRNGMGAYRSDISILKINSLSEIGVNTNPKTGKLEMDMVVITDQLLENFTQVSDFFLDSETGFINTLSDRLDTILEAGGFIFTKVNGLNSSIKSISDQRLKLATRLQSFESRLMQQFIAMDLIVSNFKNIGNFLSQQLSGFVKPMAFKE